MTDTVSPAVPRATPRAYAAFLSYSRALDAELAIVLQRELERFAKPWHQRRALRVFRDDTNLSANADLWTSIENALDDAEYLVLLASPQSARSPWVLREVEHWLRHRSPDTLLIVVTAGKIAWSGTGFDPERTDCLPEPLLRAYPLEPRWVDLRTARGSSRPDPGLPAFRNAVADLAAPLRRMPKDELVGEDLRQFRRTRHLVRLVIAVLSVLTLLAGGAAVVAVHQTGVAEQQRAEAVHQQRAAIARELLSRADAARATDPRGAARFALAAARLNPGDAATSSLVNIVTGTRIEASLPAHDDFLRTVAVSPDGRTLVSGSRGGEVVVWNITDPARPARTDTISWEPALEITRTTFSADGRLLAVGTGGGTVELWSVTGPGVLAKAGVLSAHGGPISALDLSPDGRLLVTGAYDDAIKLWDLADPAAPRPIGEPLAAHHADITDLAISPDGRTLFSAGNDAAVLAWQLTDPTHPTVIGRLAVAPTRLVFISLSPDGRRLASTDVNEGTQIWDVTNPARPQRIGAGLSAGKNVLLKSSFAPDGTVVSATSDQVLLTWNLADPTQPEVLDQLSGHSDQVVALAFGPGGLVVSGGNDGTVLLWRLADRTRPLAVGAVTAPGSGRGLSPVAVAPSTGLLAVAGGEHTIGLWDVHDPAHPRPAGPPLVGHRETIWSLSFSPDGTTLASSSFDDTIRLWDVRDPVHPTQRGDPLTGHRRDVMPVRYSPDGRTLASVDDNLNLIIWDAADPDHAREVHREELDLVGLDFSLAFAPDGRTLVVPNGRRLLGYDVTDPARPRELVPVATGQLGNVRVVAWSPDGAVLASGSEDGTVVLWDTTDVAAPRPLGPPLRMTSDRGVVAAGFAPDGRTLAVASLDRAVEVWDVTRPAHPARLGRQFSDPPGAAPVDLAFTLDGRLLAVPDGNGAALWAVAPLLELRDTAADRACLIAGRGLTEDEWADAVPGVAYEPTCG